MFGMSRVLVAIMVAAVVAGFLSACAPTLKFETGRALALAAPHASADTLAWHAADTVGRPPDSLDADLELLVYEGRMKTLVTGRLFARPGQCGKLDLYGLPGMLGGAFRWRNAEWELAVYDPPRYDSGQGHRVPLPLPGGVQAPYDALFSPFWGAILPWMPGTPLQRDSLRANVYGGPGEGGYWRVAFNPNTGMPDTLWDEAGGWTLVYSQWRHHREGKAPRLIPGRVTCIQSGQIWLEVGLRTLRENPGWQRNPFVLRKPKFPE
jgi:hypothetical protein